MNKIKKPKKRQELFMMRMGPNGSMVPADGFSGERLKAKKYCRGDLVAITVKKTRKPGFHRKAHALCKVVTENITGFEGLGAHDCLKRLQLESNTACSAIHLIMPGIGPVEYRIPDSIAFDAMEEGEFTELYNKLCDHISQTYWPSLTPKQVEVLAGFMPDQGVFMPYDSYDDWYDNGPGSVAFARRMHQSEMDYKQKRFDEIRKLEELAARQQWWLECREVHRWIISNQPRISAQWSIVEIKSAAKRAVLDWRT